MASLSLSISIRGILNGITRSIITLSGKAYQNFKKRKWTIYKVEEKAGVGNYEHTFIWAVNHKKRKGLGFHVSADMRDVVRKAKVTNEDKRDVFVPGLFGVINQPRVNFYNNRYHVVSKKFITKLAPIAFNIWRFQAAMNVREGATCYFAYSINHNSCKHWTSRAIRSARLLTLLPF